MPEKRSSAQSKFPEWWNLNLYKYLETMELIGWVWEFMRRSMLKRLLGEKPVDAMNPNPDFTHLSNEARVQCLYDRWGDVQFWEQSGLLNLPSAVLVPHVLPPGLSGKMFSAYHVVRDGDFCFDHKRLNHIDFKIDVGRHDTVIIRDLKKALIELRKRYPEPPRVSPHQEGWFTNKVLQVWDLRQYGISWRKIDSVLKLSSEDHLNPLQPARNAYNRTVQLIDQEGWQDLALYVEDDLVS